MAVAGETVYPTVAELAGLGVWVSQSITGLDFPAGYEHQLLGSGSISLSITEESAKEAGHAIEDLSIEIQAPPVSATDCKTTQTWTGLDLAHKISLGLYGPHPALAHTDWVGSGGAATPAADGTFVVTASGTPKLALTLPSNFEQIQADAPAENFPVGGPSIPTGYWVHQADYWSASYGAACPKGGTWSGTWEAAYSWRGWGWLLTRLKVPAASALVLEVKGKTLTPSDNHYDGTDTTTGDNRQTGYAPSWTNWTNEARPHMVVSGKLRPVATVPIGADQYVYWRVALDAEGVAIDPEVVNTLELTGMADGNWQLVAEPALVLDPTQNSHCTVKVFEAASQAGDDQHSGGSYRKGGLSAHVDYASYRQLFYGDAMNQNLVEDCAGLFDAQISPNYQIDNTTAWTLEQLKDLLDYCTDAWTCSVDSAYTGATTDSDSNVIPTWGFDLVPLEHSADVGTATCSFRCGTWTVARGIVCKIVTDKYIGGAAHGPAVAEDGSLQLSLSGAVQMYRRYPSANAYAATGVMIGSDATGHWCSGDLQEVYEYDGDTPHYWDYAASGRYRATPSTCMGRAEGRAPHREYLEEVQFPWDLTPIHPCITEGHISDLYLHFCAQTSNLYQRRQRSAYEGWGGVTYVGGGDYPCSYIDWRGRLTMAYQDTSTGRTKLRHSKDLGATWESTAMSVNGSFPALQEYNGIQYLVTYTSGVGQILRRSQTDFSTLMPYGAVTATSALVSSSTNADRVAFLKTDSAGRVLICGVPYGDNIILRRSLDDGETWSTVV